MCNTKKQGMPYPPMAPYDPYAHHASCAAAVAQSNDWGRFSDPTPMHGTMSTPRRPHSDREPQPMAHVPGMYGGGHPDPAMGYPHMMEVRAPCHDLYMVYVLSGSELCTSATTASPPCVSRRARTQRYANQLTY